MQVAMITGAGRGFGREFALALAARGIRVAVGSRTAAQVGETARLVAEAGGQALAIVLDVTSPEAVGDAVDRIEREWGAIHLLVNCAGMGRPYGPLWENDPEEWWRAFETNVKGPMLCCRAVLPGMLRRGSGRIVNVASGAGMFSIPYMSAYVSSKTALIRFTEVLGDETRGRGVAVFAMQPGTVRTAMAEDVLASEEGRRWLGWLCRIFDEGRDDPFAPGVDLVLRLASGEFDALSGRMFLAEAAPPDLAGQAAEIIDGNLHVLRVQLHRRGRP